MSSIRSLRYWHTADHMSAKDHWETSRNQSEETQFRMRKEQIEGLFSSSISVLPTRSQDASHQAIRHFVLESTYPFTFKIFVKECRSCENNSNGILALKIGGLHEVQCWIGVLAKESHPSPIFAGFLWLFLFLFLFRKYFDPASTNPQVLTQ